MLSVKKNINGTDISLELSGTVDESFDLSCEIPSPPSSLRLNCRQIKRVNSIGVKLWIGFFNRLAAAGTRLIFSECSPPIIDQLNVTRNFTCGGGIESVMVPFLCSSCQAQTLKSFTALELEKIWQNMPSIPCEKCLNSSKFDDFPDEFFLFLKSRVK